jgi:hypothetical protein
MLHIGYHKNFTSFGQAHMEMSKITDGRAISGINRKPY